MNMWDTIKYLFMLKGVRGLESNPLSLHHFAKYYHLRPCAKYFQGLTIIRGVIRRKSTQWVTSETLNFISNLTKRQLLSPFENILLYERICNVILISLLFIVWKNIYTPHVETDYIILLLKEVVFNRFLWFNTPGDIDRRSCKTNMNS